MIEIKNISKNFNQKQVLTNISFSLKEGEITALVGENGAGKSTLMRLICGYMSPSTGCVLINENDIIKNRIKALSDVAYVPEISSLYQDMSVYDFLLWLGKVWQIKDIDETLFSTAKRMNIIDVLDQPIGFLSKGYKKRVEIAGAVMHQPSFLILDEPTDGLDPNQRQDIRTFIKQYAKKNTVLISTHVLEDADIADRVIMLAHGTIIHDSSMSEFRRLSQTQNLNDAFRIISKQLRKSK